MEIELTVLCILTIFAQKYAMIECKYHNEEKRLNDQCSDGNLSSPVYQADILKMSPPEFLPNYRSPCWLECLESSRPYNPKSVFLAPPGLATSNPMAIANTEFIRKGLAKMEGLWDERIQTKVTSSKCTCSLIIALDTILQYKSI